MQSPNNFLKKQNQKPLKSLRQMFFFYNKRTASLLNRITLARLKNCIKNDIFLKNEKNLYFIFTTEKMRKHTYLNLHSY